MDWQFYVTLLNEGLRELPDDVALEKLKDLHGFQRRTFSVGGIKCSPRRLACVSYLHTLCGRGVCGTKKTSLNVELQERVARQRKKKHYVGGKWTHDKSYSKIRLRE